MGKSLELKIPPPVVALLVGVAMWGIARLEVDLRPALDLPRLTRAALAAPFVVAGVVIAAMGVATFRRARTTINPMKPDAATSLVTGGIYRFTRNPMYLGLTLALDGWAVFLFSPWTLLGPVAFVLYITRFQIAPEERALRDRFGESFTAYAAKVRRWV